MLARLQLRRRRLCGTAISCTLSRLSVIFAFLPAEYIGKPSPFLSFLLSIRHPTRTVHSRSRRDRGRFEVRTVCHIQLILDDLVGQTFLPRDSPKVTVITRVLCSEQLQNLLLINWSIGLLLKGYSKLDNRQWMLSHTLDINFGLRVFNLRW